MDWMYALNRTFLPGMVDSVRDASYLLGASVAIGAPAPRRAADAHANMTTPPHHAPIRSGVLLAVAAAALFGVVSPLVQAASAGAGAIASSALLYLGAAALSLVAVVAA